MGHACSIKVPDKPAVPPASPGPRFSTTASPTELIIKDSKVFKERYVTSRPPSKTVRLFDVKRKETKGEYKCRRLPRQHIPCQSKSELNAHIDRLGGLEHPHLCKFVEAFEDADFLYLIYEKASPTTLFSYIQSLPCFTEDDAAGYARQIAMALSVSHEQGIVHGRLSPSKVIVLPEESEELYEKLTQDEEEMEQVPAQVKICDMGQGVVLRELGIQQLRRHQADPSAAEQPSRTLLESTPPEVGWGPEVKLGDDGGSLPAHAFKLDIWGLGCIVYHLLTGVPPFSVGDQPVESVMDAVKHGVHFGSEWQELSAEAKDAAEVMMKTNSSLRPTAAGLLRHPWLKLRRETLQKDRLLRLLRNIRINASEGHFKRMVMRIIAQQMSLGSREMAGIERAFRFFDRNGDGILSVEEIIEGARKSGLLNREELIELERAIAMLDRDGSRTVNLLEFRAGALDPEHQALPRNLWHAFTAFDKDGNASVSVDEIEAIVRQVEASLLGKEQVDDLVTTIRAELEPVTYKNHIDFDQFVYIMMTPTGKPDRTLAMRRDVSRLAFNCVGHDCYEVRKIPPRAWNWQLMSQSPQSAYRRYSVSAAHAVREHRTSEVLPPRAVVDRHSMREQHGAARGRQSRQPGQTSPTKRS